MRVGHKLQCCPTFLPPSPWFRMRSGINRVVQGEFEMWSQSKRSVVVPHSGNVPNCGVLSDTPAEAQVRGGGQEATGVFWPFRRVSGTALGLC